jgi:hypothetical protein
MACSSRRHSCSACRRQAVRCHTCLPAASCARIGDNTVCSCFQVPDDSASFSAQQAHFGRDAIESALNTAAPGLVERSAELLQRLQDQLGDAARDLPGLPSAGDTGATPMSDASSWQGSRILSHAVSRESSSFVHAGATLGDFVRSPVSALQAAQRSLLVLVNALGTSLAQGTEVTILRMRHGLLALHVCSAASSHSRAARCAHLPDFHQSVMFANRF